MASRYKHGYTDTGRFRYIRVYIEYIIADEVVCIYCEVSDFWSFSGSLCPLFTFGLNYANDRPFASFQSPSDRLPKPVPGSVKNGRKKVRPNLVEKAG